MVNALTETKTVKAYVSSYVPKKGGLSTIGVVIVDAESNEKIFEEAYNILPTGRNRANYVAIRAAAQLAYKKGFTDVTVLGNNQLIVNQINGHKEPRNPDMHNKMCHAGQALFKLKKWAVEYIPVHQNIAHEMTKDSHRRSVPRRSGNLFNDVIEWPEDRIELKLYATKAEYKKFKRDTDARNNGMQPSDIRRKLRMEWGDMWWYVIKRRDRVHVTWTDGPTAGEVEKFVSRFIAEGDVLVIKHLTNMKRGA